jgi:hypothetical protein
MCACSMDAVTRSIAEMGFGLYLQPSAAAASLVYMVTSLAYAVAYLSAVRRDVVSVSYVDSLIPRLARRFPLPSASFSWPSH